IAWPSTWTTQAPHWEVSQPTCVPVRRRFSRRYCTKSVRVSTSAVTGLPFTVIETVGMVLPPQNCGPKPFFLTRAGLVVTAKGEIASFSPGCALGWGQSEPRPQPRSRDLVTPKERQFGRLRRRFLPVVSRFRSSPEFAARAEANFG